MKFKTLDKKKDNKIRKILVKSIFMIERKSDMKADIVFKKEYRVKLK